MRKIFYSIMACFVVLALISGCKANGTEFPENCADAALDDQSACCAEQNKDALTVQCVGSWTFSEEQGCAFECEVDIPDDEDSDSIDDADDSSINRLDPIEIEIN